MNFLENKIALITGASSGIGAATAKKLSEYGVNLILTGRDENKLQQLKNSLQTQTLTFAFDIRNKKEVEKFVNEILSITHIDILVNNAGLALGLERIDEGDIEDWETMIDTNIKGVLYITKPIFKHMKERNEGHIVNLGSVAGKTAYPGGNVYCTTKAALHSLSESLNIDAFGTNIKVSTIAPGAVETEFSNVRFKGNKQKAKKVYEGYVPLSAEDIADTIVCVLNTPPHVNIQYVDIMPTNQRNPYMLYRDS
ncbi:SDR family NAD(P)-dependent oxidoreductase [Caminibacter pacificus]